MEYKKVNQNVNNIVNEQVKKLAQVFPSAVKDGEVDFDALKEELGLFTEAGPEKYELTWAGKAEAKRIAKEDIAGKTLKFIPEDSKNADTTENLYIEGDNLEVLKLLRQNYYGAIKMIYIDPPYNTGNDFVYNDFFDMSKEDSDREEGAIAGKERYTVNSKSKNRFHARWLNMIYSRLIVAKDLMTDDGIIFISIDDNELANMMCLCNEIFGEENFVSILSVEVNPKGRKNSKFISVSNDYCLIYAKDINSGYFVENVPKNIKDLTQDENGNYVHNSGKRVLVGENNFNNFVSNYSSSKHYSVYYKKSVNSMELRKEKSIDDIDENLIVEGFERFISHYQGKFVENTYTEAKFLELFNEQKLDFKNGKIYEKNMSTVIRLKSMLVNREYEAVIDGKATKFFFDFKTTSAGTMLKKLFDSDDVFFSAPKNIGLLKVLMTLIDGYDFYVLDFFSGSGTTAHAVMEQNIIDVGNRKYILVQMEEVISEKEPSYKAGYRTICQLGKDRIRKSAEVLSSRYSCDKVDLGFKVFRVADTNIKWNSLMDKGQLDISQIESTPDLMDFMPDTKDIDVVYELMLRQRDVALSETLELLSDIGSRTYLYASSFLVCLETEVTERLVEKLAAIAPLPIKFIFRDSAFKDNIAFKDETFRRLKALVEKNSGERKPVYTVEFI